MLVNLSSVNEADHAKFSNYFNDGFVIGRNSVICLVKGQVAQDDASKSITITDGTPLRIKWDCYNIQEFILNPGADTTYTPQAFVDYIASLIPDDTCQGYGQRFTVQYDEDAEDTLITFIIYRITQTLNVYNPMNIVYSADNYKRTYLADCVNSADGSIAQMVTSGPGNLGGGSLQSQFGRSFIALNDFGATALSFDPQYFPPVDMPNRFAFQQSIADILESNMEWIIGRGNCDEFEICLGNQENTTAYRADRSPTIATDHNNGEVYYRMCYKRDGSVQHEVYNNTTDTMDALVQYKQNPGDRIRINLKQIDNASYTPNSVKQYFPIILIDYTEGLTYWYSGRGVGSYTDNTTGLPPSIPIDVFMSDNYDNAYPTMLAEYNSSGFKDWGITGTKRVAGFSKEVGFETTEPATGGGFYCASTATPQLIGKTIPDPAFLSTQNMRQLIRYELTHVGGGLPTHKRVFKLSPGKSFPLTNPWAIFMNVSPGNDGQARGGGVADNVQTWFASDDHPIIKFYLQGTTTGYDIEVRQADGTLHTAQLINVATAQRITAFLGTYYMKISYDGSMAGLTTPRQMNFSFNEYTTGNVYTASITLTGELENMTNIGGIDPENQIDTFDSWAYGNFNAFRFYEASDIPLGQNWIATEARPDAINDWKGALFNKLWGILRNPTSTNYINNITDNDFFFGRGGSYVVMGNQANAGITQITNGEPPNPLRTNSVGLSAKEHAVSSFDTFWYDLVNFNCPNALLLPIGNQFGESNAEAYSQVNKGIVSASAIGDEIDFNNPAPDANGNVVLQAQVEAGLGLQHPIIELEGELEDIALEHEVMNVEITNLSHRSFNGANHQVDKTIYQIPAVGADRTSVDNLDIIEITPPQKVWIDLNNSMDIPINKLDVQISDKLGKKLENLRPNTNLSLEIRPKNNVNI